MGSPLRQRAIMPSQSTETNASPLPDQFNAASSARRRLPGIGWLTQPFRQKSLLVESRLSLAMVFVVPTVAALLVSVVLVFTGLELGMNLTIVGLIYALFLPLSLEIRHRSSRPRRVRIIDYRFHQYGHAVARGAMRTLKNDSRQWIIDYKAPDSATSTGSLKYQIREIQEASLYDVDAILLIPAADDESLWRAVAALIKTGCFVVTVDTKPPHDSFRGVGIETPRFVSTKYDVTGTLTAQIITEFLDDDVARRAVLWIGPEGSWPGEERSRNIVYSLAQKGDIVRSFLLPIDGWAPEVGRCRRTLEYVRQCEGPVAVYCADDENAMALHLYCMTEEPHLRKQMYIIGCNGTSDDWGGVPALDSRSVEATIDIMAEEQGIQAGMFMVRERSGRLDPSDRSLRVPPRILYRTTNANRWIQSLFSEDRIVVSSSGEIPRGERHYDPSADSAPTVLVESQKALHESPAADPTINGDRSTAR